MSLRQWEVWKARPPAFERDHWVVIISGQELCADPRELLVNGLACFSLLGQPGKVEVRLNSADGFSSRCRADRSANQIKFVHAPRGSFNVAEDRPRQNHEQPHCAVPSLR